MTHHLRELDQRRSTATVRLPGHRITTRVAADSIVQARTRQHDALRPRSEAADLPARLFRLRHREGRGDHALRAEVRAARAARGVGLRTEELTHTPAGGSRSRVRETGFEVAPEVRGGDLRWRPPQRGGREVAAPGIEESRTVR